MATVEAQCARGAAALANARYQMRIAAGGVVSQGGADLDTIVYSFAVTQSNVNISTHLAEFTGQTTIFHIYFYDNYGLRKGESIMHWRYDFNNVLEWLIGNRLTWFKGILGRIIQKGQAAIIPQIIALESGTENQSSISEVGTNEGSFEIVAALSAQTSPTVKDGKKRRL